MMALVDAIRAQHGPDCIPQLALALFYRCDWLVKPALDDPFWTRRAIKMAEQAHVDFDSPKAEATGRRGQTAAKVAGPIPAMSGDCFSHHAPEVS